MANDPTAGIPAGPAATPDVLRALRAADPHPADVAEALDGLSPADAAGALAHMPFGEAVAALDHPELTAAPEILTLLPPDAAARLVAGMAEDRAADVLGGMEHGAAEAILARLDDTTRFSLRGLLVWPAHSAGGMMTTEFVAMPTSATVAATLEHIRTVERSRETVYSIYFLDPRGALAGTVSLRQLVCAEPDARALDLAGGRAPITVTPSADREEVASLIRRHNLLAVPVVDEARRVLGIVTVDDVLDAIVAEGTEDAQKFGGVEALDKPYLDTGFAAMLRKRAGWLAVLFLSEMLTASAMQHFEAELERAIVLTLFIPLIMSSGGNSGSQATSLIIRALALGQVRLRDWWRVALREAPTGLVLGAFLGAIGMARIALWQQLGFYDYGPHWMLVGATVAAGLVGIVTFGSLAGSMLPFLLQRLGFDPASASAPFVATLVDVTGLIIYFSIALVILSGTLL